MSTFDALLEHAAMAHQWTRCTVDDIPEDQFCDQPGGQTNHPAWVLGHLVFAFDNFSRTLGATPAKEESWYDPFRAGSSQSSDPSAYPSKQELIDAFDESSALLRATVRGAGESKLAEPVADESIAPFFPTLGRWAVHVLASEGVFHSGQLSAWRRAKGLPSVFDVEANIGRLLADSLEV